MHHFDHCFFVRAVIEDARSRLGHKRKRGPRESLASDDHPLFSLGQPAFERSREANPRDGHGQGSPSEKISPGLSKETAVRGPITSTQMVQSGLVRSTLRAMSAAKNSTMSMV